MPPVTISQHAFTSGEWSPRLYGRQDIQRYVSACSVLENMIVMPHGAATRRMGTEYVWDAPSGDILLLPFVFNTEQAYVLEFTPNLLRFYRDGGIITNAPGQPFSLPTPWTASDLRRLQTAQSADVMYIVCGRVQPHKLTRPGADLFALAPVAFTAKPADWTGENQPAAVAFHQQRLWFGGTPLKPQSIWASKTANFENFTTGSEDDAALVFSLVSNMANAVRWMKSTKALLVGSSGGEWSITGAETDAPITNKSIRAVLNSNYGTSSVIPVMVGKGIIDLSASRKSMREFRFEYAEDGYICTELSLLAEHISRRGIRQIAYAQETEGIIWACLDDGGLAGCTFLREQEVIAWHRHPTEGEVLSVACIPEENQTETWLAVRRKNGVHVERMLPFWNGETSAEPGCWFVDCGLIYEGDPIVSVSGLDHLEGCLVDVLADGASNPPRVVTNGEIELQSPARIVIAGLPLPWRIAPMFQEGFSQRGTAQGKRQRVVRLSARVYKTMGLQYKLFGASQSWETPGRDVSDSMDAPPPPRTGDLEMPMPGGWSADARFELFSTAPLPATLVMTMAEMVTNE